MEHNTLAGRKQYVPAADAYNPYKIVGRHDYNPSSLVNLKKMQQIEMLDGKIDSYNTIDYSNKDNMLIKESNSPGSYSRAYDRSALKKNAEFMMTPNINKTPMKMMTRDPTPQEQYLGPVYDKNQRASAPQYDLP